MIRSRRIKLGLSQARLGALVDRTATTIRRWERGEVVPPNDSLPALAAALEVDVADLRPAPALDSGPATIVVSSPLTPPPAPPQPAPSEEPPTIVQPALPAAAEGERPRQARPPARAKPPAPPPPARPPGRAQPAPAGSTDRAAAEPWIQFETESIPTSVPPPPARVTAPPASALPITEQPTQEVPAPPPPMPQQPRVQVVQPKSYLEDPKQRVLYVTRMVMVFAFLGVMAVVLVWALGEFLQVMDDALNLFSDTTTLPPPVSTP